ncbi:MAG: hypothetical protein IJO70_02600 [Lachnospiraceae bacterium]|nr:hypothetical protein [Lachnospiraceae bacterium]
MNTECVKLIDDSRPINLELTNFKRRVIPWTIMGFIITLVMGAHTIITIKSYCFDGNNSSFGQENILFCIIMLSIATLFGISLIYTGAKLIFNIKNMLVANVEITNISFEGWNFFYKGRCNIIENGKKRVIEVPMYFGDISGIRKTKKAKLYYASNKAYLLVKWDDNIIENQLKAFSAYKQKENLIAMNDMQKEAVLHKIYSKACMEIFKAITIPLAIGLLIFIMFSFFNNSSSASYADIAISAFIAMIIFLDFIESFIKYISMIIIVGKLKKSALLWVVLPVTQCTRSVNILEKGYRYAHYYYKEKMYKDWMMIGRNQIDRVICLVSDVDKEKPYGFLYGWFRGILY